jgi:hypothetical protein
MRIYHLDRQVTNITSIFQFSAISLAATLLAIPAAAAPADPVPWEDPLPRPELSAKVEMPSPAEILGHPVGAEILSPHQVVAAARALAELSPRVVFRTHGKTAEGRDLFHLIISDPLRLQHLEDDVDENGPAAGAAPLVLWLAGGVHGDEHSSTEALLLTAWHLAADDTPEGADLLNGAVIILEPLQNPDGRERFHHHLDTSRFGAANSDPEAWEHNQNWPGGRGNHYFFDLNRDWFLARQQETRARLPVYRRWQPHVFVDLHEMGGDSRYFFAPPALPIHSAVPQSTRRWWDRFGNALAGAFDARGATYYRREIFDIFYPGYGDSWPTLNGAVGMTFEQASVRGLVRRRKDEVVMTVGEAIGNHLTAALTTIRFAAGQGPALRDDRNKLDAVDDDLLVFLPPEDASGRRQQVESILQAQGVRVQQLARGTRVRGLQDYRGGAPRSVELPEGTRVITGQGRGGRLAGALLAPDEPLPEPFVTEERRLLLAGRPGRVFDVTAWSLPLVYDLAASWSRQEQDLPLSPVLPPTSWTSPSRARTAYLLPPAGLPWAQAVGELLDAGVRVRVASRSMTRDGVNLAAGTAVIMVQGQDESLHELVARSGEHAGVRWLTASSSASEAGIDLGSDKVIPLHAAAIAVVTGSPVSPTGFGAVADLLTGAVSRPFTALPIHRIAHVDLARYGVLVLPDGSAAGYRRALYGPGVKALRRYIATGGVVVAIKGAAAFCGHEKVNLCRTGSSQAVKPEQEDGGNGGAPEEALWQVSGAIARVVADTEEPLMFGQRASLPVPVQGDLILKAPQRRDVRVVAHYAEGEQLRLAGHIWPEAAERLSGSPWLVRETHGRGRVILFAGEPCFRGAWDGLRAVLMNALMMEPGR